MSSAVHNNQAALEDDLVRKGVLSQVWLLWILSTYVSVSRTADRGIESLHGLSRSSFERGLCQVYLSFEFSTTAMPLLARTRKREPMLYQFYPEPSCYRDVVDDRARNARFP